MFSARKKKAKRNFSDPDRIIVHDLDMSRKQIIRNLIYCRKPEALSRKPGAFLKGLNGVPAD
jgi:hypothetical protein